MTDSEMRRLLVDCLTAKAEWYSGWTGRSRSEATRHIGETNSQNPPASVGQIDRFEANLGRALSPSFKHFLTVANGWMGFFRNELSEQDCLVGTETYSDDAFVQYWKMWNEIFVSAWGGPDIDTSLAAFHPYHFYRIIDGSEACPVELEPAKQFILSYAETRDEEHMDDDLMLARYVLVGWGPNKEAVLLDSATLRADGEMDVLLYNSGDLCPTDRYSDFYEFLRLTKRE